MQQKSIKSEN